MKIEKDCLIDRLSREPFLGINCLLSDVDQTKKDIILTEYRNQNSSYIMFSSDLELILDAEEIAKDNHYQTMIVDVVRDYQRGVIRKKVRSFLKYQKNSYFAIFFMIPQNVPEQVEKIITYCHKRIVAYLNFYKKRTRVLVILHPYSVIKHMKVSRPHIFHNVSLLLTSHYLTDILQEKTWKKMLYREPYRIFDVEEPSAYYENTFSQKNKHTRKEA